MRGQAKLREANTRDAVTASTIEIVPSTNLPAGQEAQLVTELAAGDPAALARWFQRNQPGVYAFAYFRVGQDADLAADATQATFAQALECLEQFDPRRGDMMTWLRTLARNIIRRLLNQQKRNMQFGRGWGCIDETLLRAFERIDSQPLPEVVLERQETRELVAMTLAALPQQYHELLEAKYMRSEPLEAIAQRRNCTLDGVKSMLRRARAAFRESFLALAKIEASEVEVSDA